MIYHNISILKTKVNFTCHICGRSLPCKPGERSCGYVITQNMIVCYDCQAELEASAMISGNKTFLYVVNDGITTPKITNHPGTLRLPVLSVATGPHNLCGKQFHYRFLGPDGAMWSGRNVGDNTYVRCRKLKRQKKNLTPVNYKHPYNYAK